MSHFCENPNEPLRIQKVENFRIPPHLHTSAELLYIENGEATLTLGSLEFNLHSGDFVLIMPSTLHSVTPVSGDLTLYVINTKCELISDIIKRLSGLRPASPVLRSIDVPQHLLYAFSAVASERDRYIAYSWIHLMFSIVVSGLRFAEIHDGVTSNLSNRVLSYLGMHYREQISLDQLADAMGVSRFHLSHLFSGKLGIGFKEYLNNLRVEYAKGLLRTTDTPIANIYKVSGFENQRTFNRVFKENTGASPRDYRLGRENFGLPDLKKMDVNIPLLDKNVSDISDIQITDEFVDVPLEIEEIEPQNSKTPHKARVKKPVQTKSDIKSSIEKNTDVTDKIVATENSMTVDSKIPDLKNTSDKDKNTIPDVKTDMSNYYSDFKNSKVNRALDKTPDKHEKKKQNNPGPWFF